MLSRAAPLLRSRPLASSLRSPPSLLGFPRPLSSSSTDPRPLGRAAQSAAQSARTTNALKTPVSWKGLALASVLSAAAAGFYKLKQEEKTKKTLSKVVTTGKPSLGGDWCLLDSKTGGFVTNKTYEGGYTVVYFGFAHCPDICPSELRKLSAVIDGMKGEVDLRGLFVTVDPARDSMDNLRIYAKDFHPGIEYLTGTPGMIEKMAALYRVYISKADETDDGDYLVDHSIVLYLVGPDGKFRDFFTQGMKASDVVDKVRKVVKEDAAEAAA